MIVTPRLRKQRIAHQTYHGGIRLSRGVDAYHGTRLRSLVGVVGEFMLLCSRVMLDRTLDSSLDPVGGPTRSRHGVQRDRQGG